MSVTRCPISDDERAIMPIIAVTRVVASAKGVASIIRMTGDSTKIYGMMNAAIASFDAFTPVFSALPPLMAAPAYAARATGGVTSAIMPK